MNDLYATYSMNDLYGPLAALTVGREAPQDTTSGFVPDDEYRERMALGMNATENTGVFTTTDAMGNKLAFLGRIPDRFFTSAPTEKAATKLKGLLTKVGSEARKVDSCPYCARRAKKLAAFVGSAGPLVHAYGPRDNKVEGAVWALHDRFRAYPGVHYEPMFLDCRSDWIWTPKSEELGEKNSCDRKYWVHVHLPAPSNMGDPDDAIVEKLQGVKDANGRWLRDMASSRTALHRHRRRHLGADTYRIALEDICCRYMQQLGIQIDKIRATGEALSSIVKTLEVICAICDAESGDTDFVLYTGQYASTAHWLREALDITDAVTYGGVTFENVDVRTAVLVKAMMTSHHFRGIHDSAPVHAHMAKASMLWKWIEGAGQGKTALKQIMFHDCSPAVHGQKIAAPTAGQAETALATFKKRHWRRIN